MVLAEKIEKLKIYSIGTTHFMEKEKKFFAHSYYTSAFEMAEDEEVIDNSDYLVNEGEFKTLYASTVEEVVNKALKEERIILAEFIN